MLGIGLIALAVSVYCSYVGLTVPNAGAAGVGGLCVVASFWLIVDAIKGRR
jgi:hypothetical protein